MSSTSSSPPPPFLDLTFIGLEALPAPGEERFAGDLLRSPGGGAITAIGAARLGLTPRSRRRSATTSTGGFIATRCAPRASRWSTSTPAAHATTVVMPRGGERAMVTYEPGSRARAADVAALAPRAVVVRHQPARRACPTARTPTSTCGDEEARAYASGCRAALAGHGAVRQRAARRCC